MVYSASVFEVKHADAFDRWLLLCGGDKGSQDADIKNELALWRELNPPPKKSAKKE
jgi:putative component of toxin-antitoxin plasmid stabilization module